MHTHDTITAFCSSNTCVVLSFLDLFFVCIAQIVTSILISSVAVMYHIHAAPFKERWLNLLQGASLLLVYLTLQAGLAVKSAAADDASVGRSLVVLEAASIFLLISPVFVFVIASVKLLPHKWRRRLAVCLGLEEEAFVGEMSIVGTLPGSNKAVRFSFVMASGSTHVS
jgi:hypothetical protein